MNEAALVLKSRRHWGRIVAVVQVHLAEVVAVVENSEPDDARI